jgi:hypothetical protein
MPDRAPLNDSERDEIVLRVKKATYDEETELSGLRSAVSNIEAAIEYQRGGQRRDPIPEHVKLLVWARDGGACVRCGAKMELHFDHIIPVVKGAEVRKQTSKSSAKHAISEKPTRFRSRDLMKEILAV